MNESKKVIIGGGIFLVLLIIAVYFLVTKTQTSPFNLNQAGNPVNEKLASPTLSPEETKIVSELKDYTVKIDSSGFTPETVTVKPHDQVFWVNNDTVQHKVKGEGWGNVPINPGEKFVRAFNTPGTFNYTDASNPEMKGTIIVK